jgi:hypothetical protein
LFAWYAAEVARVLRDEAWAARLAPRLIENAEWTMRARRQGERDEYARGLLPRNIYGGDVRESAYSLYPNAACWRGLVETSEALRAADPERSRRYRREGDDLKKSLARSIGRLLAGVGAEGPYPRLTADPLGNYWNLFAPLFLHLNLLDHRSSTLPSAWLTDYAERRGGLWAGLPRFYDGLDAAYAIGYVHELLERAKTDARARPKALAALSGFMLHGASRKGYGVPEVAPLFAGRVDRREYERLVRTAPWTFGVYDDMQYLKGRIPVSEPLAAGAGEGLWLVRKALLDETRDREGLPDGGLVLLAAVPSDWLGEGRTVSLRRMPTAYGLVSLETRSEIESQRRVLVRFRLEEPGGRALRSLRLRLVAPGGRKPRDHVGDGGTVELPPVSDLARTIAF